MHFSNKFKRQAVNFETSAIYISDKRLVLISHFIKNSSVKKRDHKKEKWAKDINVWQKPLQYCKVISLIN